MFILISCLFFSFSIKQKLRYLQNFLSQEKSTRRWNFKNFPNSNVSIKFVIKWQEFHLPFWSNRSLTPLYWPNFSVKSSINKLRMWRTDFNTYCSSWLPFWNPKTSNLVQKILNINFQSFYSKKKKFCRNLACKIWFSTKKSPLLNKSVSRLMELFNQLENPEPGRRQSIKNKRKENDELLNISIA